MSIIINGVDKPDRCGVCPCFHPEHPMYCQAVKADKIKKISAPYGKPRPDWCPLVEIPEGARLIDVRDAKKHMIPLDFSVQNWISEVDLDIRVPTIFKENKE